ncbi:hypothetical protein IGI04_006885 [Brassica rapa subsp. trilocularis]|uniref:Uncharacterized protein n=1 Tax=Brassica rapa subsp. trilocularis TaxID=1813537 RepID=A0ABQ7NI53_BRACM|nr:hypothetical protein IGI04_006885 [Brassica rapa subsp. trilocularis]
MKTHSTGTFMSFDQILSFAVNPCMNLHYILIVRANEKDITFTATLLIFLTRYQHDCALHLRKLSPPAFPFPASSSGAQPLLHRRSAFSPPGHLSLSAGKLLSLSKYGQISASLSRWSSQILVVKKNTRVALSSRGLGNCLNECLNIGILESEMHRAITIIQDHREREAESWPEFERERSFPAERERWPGGEKAERRWSKG